MTVIRLTALLHRKPETSHAEFLEHWHGRHGPLIAALPSASLIVRYEQHPAMWPAEASGLPEPGYDGVAMQWFATMNDFVTFALKDDRPVVAADEERFLDTARIEWILTEEPVVVLGDG